MQLQAADGSMSRGTVKHVSMVPYRLLYLLRMMLQPQHRDPTFGIAAAAVGLREAAAAPAADRGSVLKGKEGAEMRIQ